MTKKTISKKIKNVTKTKVWRTPKISTAMELESLLARMVDTEDKGDRIVIMVEFLKGAPRKFQSDVLLRMTRESRALMLEAAVVMVEPWASGKVEKQVVQPPTIMPSGITNQEEAPVSVPEVPLKTAKVIIGPYSSKWSADQDVAQLRHPKVMQYRSTVFPAPSTFGVTATVTGAERVELSKVPGAKARHPTITAAYPFGIEVVVSLEGPDKKVANWITAFENLNHFTKAA